MFKRRIQELTAGRAERASLGLDARIDRALHVVDVHLEAESLPAARLVLEQSRVHRGDLAVAKIDDLTQQVAEIRELLANPRQDSQGDSHDMEA